MTLYDKILIIYPELKIEDFTIPGMSGIVLQNVGDSRGDYIAKWEHPDYPEPTQEQLDAIN